MVSVSGEAGSNGDSTSYVPRLKSKYNSEIIDALKKDLELSNIMMVPKVLKVVLNMGVGEAVYDSKKVKQAFEQMKLISGQCPVFTYAKKSVSSFKLREGVAIGCKVTLRRNMMYDFLDRLVTIALPRVRDFRGLSPRGFDRGGNYCFGIKEHIVFPEVDDDSIEDIYGMDVCVVTSANSPAESKTLLKLMGFPFYS